MSYEFEFGTLRITANDQMVRGHEFRKDLPLFEKVAGLLIAAAFLGAAGFFWIMPVADADQVFWLRVILCGGLALIGLLVLWGTFGRKRKFYFVEADARTGDLVNGYDTATDRVEENRMKLADVEILWIGSDALPPRTTEGITALYVKGDGAPRKGALITGGHVELSDLTRRIMAFCPNAEHRG